jgi:hypothetical protein
MAHFYINGDATGRNRSATSHQKAYDMIRSFLDLSWEQFNVPTINPGLADSKRHVNHLLKK